MKNKLFILFFLVLSTTLIFGQSIKVTNPGSKTVLMKGQTLKITWVKQGRQNAFVKIRLFNSTGKKIVSITEKTKNKGLFNWRFNIDVPPGQYFIRVKTIDNKVTGNSRLFRSGKNSPSPAKISGDFKDDPFHKKTYQLDTEKYQVKKDILKSNTIFIPENKTSDPVVLSFKADPKEIKNGQKYFLRYHYKNATEYAKLYTFKNGRKDRFIKSLPIGADISGRIEMGPVSWNDHTYCLEVANFKSMFSSTARVKVKLELQILSFDSTFEKYMVGRPVRLTYSFIAASKAYIKNITTGKIVKVIDTKGGNVINEAFVFPFKETSEFKLFIKEYSIPTYLESDIVKITEIR